MALLYTIKPLVFCTPNPKTETCLVLSCGCLRPIHLSQMLSLEWRYSRSRAKRRCSNYIWVINNFIAYKGATYIRSLTVRVFLLQAIMANTCRYIHPWEQMLYNEPYNWNIKIVAVTIFSSMQGWKDVKSQPQTFQGALNSYSDHISFSDS